MSLSEQEKQRLEALKAYNILDTGAERVYEDITFLASQIFKTPIALISLIDEHRQWFKSKRGIKVSETSRNLSFCDHAIRQKNTLVVPDATKDERFQDNPFVTGDPEIRFYAGALLFSSSGQALGTLCVIDKNPRKFSEEEVSMLEILARQVMTQFELRKANAILKENEESLYRIRHVMENLNVGIWEWNIDTNQLLWDKSMYRLYQVDPNSFSGHYDAWEKSLYEKGESKEKLIQDLQNSVKNNTKFTAEFRIRTSSGEIKYINALAEILFSKEKNTKTMIGINWDSTEQKIKDSFYKGVFENSYQPIVTVNLEKKITRANEAFAKMLGYSVEDIQGKSVQELTFEEDVKLSDEALDQAIEKKREVTIVLEKRYKSASGKIVPVLIRSQLICNIEGKPSYFLSYITDLTSVKQTEESLRQSEEKFRKLFNFAPVGMIVLDDSNRIIMANKSYQTLLGYSLEELTNKSLFDMTHPDDLEEIRDLNNNFIKTRKNIEGFVKRKIRKDGKAVWVRISSSFFTLSEGDRIISIVEDISKAHQAELDLEEAHKHLKIIFNSMGEGLVIQNRDGSIFDHNPAVLKITGLSQQQLIDYGLNKMKRVLYKEDGTHLSWDERPSQLAFKTGKPQMNVTIGVVIDESKGVKTWTSINAIPIFKDGEKEPYQVVITSTDITEIKNTQLKLLDQNKIILESRERERKANNAKSEFLSNISHEIRTPLNGIIGMADLLAGTRLNDEQSHYTDTIIQSGNLLISLINDILDLSKIESGMMSLDEKEFDLNQCLEEVSVTHQFKCKAKAVKFEKSLARLSTRVVSDKNRCIQIINNLLANAVKFTQKGYVRLSTIILTETDNIIELKISVEDSGIGIPKDKQHKLFSAFAQIDESISTKYGGTGLGLSIVKNLVTLMGGEVRFDSEENEGSQFEVLLKFNKGQYLEARSTIAEKYISPTRDFENMFSANLLVAEDNPINQSIVKNMLEHMGCAVQIVENGKKVIEILSRKDFDLIFMDCRMPEMDGYECTRLIRAINDPKKANIKIIALTANASEMDKNKCLTSGMNDFISKPITKEKLYQTLVKYLKSEKKLVFKKEKLERKTQNIDIILIKELISMNTAEDPFFFKRQKEDFEKYVNELIRNISLSIKKMSREEIAEYAHSLKGSFANFGAKSVAKLCNEMERDAYILDEREFEAILDSIRMEMDHFMNYLEEV